MTPFITAHPLGTYVRHQAFPIHKRLPESRRKERAEAVGIRDFAESLIEK